MPRWTEEARAKQAAIARQNRPWDHSTGPRTRKGKQICAQNACRHGYRSQGYRDLCAALRNQAEFMRSVRDRLKTRPDSGSRHDAQNLRVAPLFSRRLSYKTAIPLQSILIFKSIPMPEELQKIKKARPLTISKAFNASSCVARCFELRENFRGIAGYYKIPDGYTASAYEDLMSSQLWQTINKDGNSSSGFWGYLKANEPPQVLRQSWDRLLKLNPKLEGVRSKTGLANELYAAHIGVTSSYNVDDINFFLDLQAQDLSAAYHGYTIPGHGERLQRIDMALKPHTVQWVLSPQTAIKIENRLVRRGLIDRKMTRNVTSAEERDAYANTLFNRKRAPRPIPV